MLIPESIRQRCTVLSLTVPFARARQANFQVSWYIINVKKYVSKQLVLDKLFLDCYNSEQHHVVEAGAIFDDPLMDDGKKDARKQSRRQAKYVLTYM
jgi:hypothetical protein